jgi:hypothetical protein
VVNPVAIAEPTTHNSVTPVGAVAGRSLYFHGGTVSVTKPVR